MLVKKSKQDNRTGPVSVTGIKNKNSSEPSDA